MKRNDVIIEKIQKTANRIRLRVLEHSLESGGYLSQACSSAEMLAALYLDCMNLGESEGPMIPKPFGKHDVPSQQNKNPTHGAIYNGPRSSTNDRFFLSPTHYALSLYATLIEVKRLSPDALQLFNKDGSSVEMIGGEHSPGHEVNGGSFGQAICQAAGVAIGRRLKGDTGRVWVFMSDGEFQEGQTWEALLTMANHRVDNITLFVDVNNQQVDGRMEDVMEIEPLYEKIAAFGAHVVKINGHNIQEILQTTEEQHEGKPLVILAYTCPYQGIDLLKERSPYLHYIRFKSDDERNTYREFLRAHKERVS